LLRFHIGSIMLFFFSLPLTAQESSPTASELDKAAQRENPVTSIPYESGRKPSTACEDRWSNFLPIWGKEACAQGYVLPRPFGVSVGYMHQDQPFDVGDVIINGVDVKTPGVAVVDEVQNEESTITLRFDVWVLPFWNVYGILGKTDGEAVGPLAINLDPIPEFEDLCNILPPGACQIDTTFEIDYEADVVGLGTTIAGGYKDFFGMVDINYSEADLDISVTDAEATVISARVGWNGKLGGFAGVLWIGAMYQDIEQVLELELPVGDETLNVLIDQSTQEPLNYIVGGQWDINRSFSVLAELGFGERRSEMLNLTYRF
jgi:hypothetical protein